MPQIKSSRYAPAAFPAILCWCALAVLPGKLSADPSPPGAATPPVREIVQKAIAQDDARRARRVAFEADQTVLTEHLDLDGKVLSSKTVHLIHHPTKEISFSSTTESSNASSDAAHPDADTVKAQQIMAVMNLGKLAPRFTETVTGSATIQGRDCYVVSYRPKPDQYSANREEKVVNNVAGRFWIAKDNFDILQSEGSLVGPVTVALIASVTRMDFKFHSLQLPNGDVCPADFSVDMTVHAPFYNFRQLQVNTLANWRPRGAH